MLDGTWSEELTVTTADGLQLQAVGTAAARDQVALIINAYGMPPALVAPIARKLADRYRVLTWSARGLPGPMNASTDLGTASHVGDAIAMLNAIGAEKADLVIGWCTGARVALHLARAHAARVGGMVLVGGSYRYLNVPRTSYDRELDPVLKRVSQNPRLASFICSTWNDKATRVTAEVGSYLDQADQSLQELTRLPYSGPDALCRYASLCNIEDAQDDLQIACALTVPTLVVCGAGDRIAHPEASAAIAAALPRGRLESVAGGDHYIPYMMEDELNTLIQTTFPLAHTAHSQLAVH